uniref:Uncharacterized protein n=1 Tax=Aegilops tauschii subsp. strangulata TaxID=200361 RepID=A0A453SEX6_AEGTS
MMGCNAARRADVGGAAGPPRRAEREPERGQLQPPERGVQPRRPHRHVRQQGAVGAGHDGAVRRAHHRAGPVRHLPRPHLQRHQRRRQVRGAPEADVPADRRRRHARAHRRVDADLVRHHLLREPREQAGAFPLGPGAVQRRVAGRDGEGVHAQPGHIRRRLRQGDGEDGEPHAVGGHAHGDPSGLQEDQLRSTGPEDESVVSSPDELARLSMLTASLRVH